MSALDLVTFDTSGFEPRGDQYGTRVWYSPVGDGVGLYYYAAPPDINADLEALDQVRAFYRNAASASGSAIIEVEAPIVDGFRAVRVIIKVPQEPTGMTYLGTLTLPFRAFSYVLKVQCEEHGVTGVRDAVVLDQLLACGEVSVSTDGRLEGWMADPYDASLSAPILRNRAEAAKYDAPFPSHPLSRLRLTLGHIQGTLQIASELRDAPPFAYFPPRGKRKPWWRW